MAPVQMFWRIICLRLAFGSLNIPFSGGILLCEINGL